MKDSYLFQDETGCWFALLPNTQYKKIPYINWVEDINWSVIYYQVYDSLIHGIITDSNLVEWDLQKILEIAADVRL